VNFNSGLGGAAGAAHQPPTGGAGYAGTGGGAAAGSAGTAAGGSSGNGGTAGNAADAGTAGSEIVDASSPMDASQGGTAGDAGADAAAPLDAGTTDASTTDASTTDASTTDAGTTDASTTDAGTTDASTTDASTTDASTTDASTTDASTTDASTTDASTTDANIPDSSVTDANIPDSSVTDSGPKDAGAKDSGSPDAGASCTGFDAQSSTWPLPTGSAASFPQTNLNQTLGCSTSTQFSWSTFDIDGDALPDLVVTQKCFDATLGVTHWDVYKNTGGGFAASPAAWSLPSGAAASFPFKDNAVSNGCSSSAQFSWSTFDIDGDALPDLVVTQKCFDSALGATRWDVYKNTGSGFASTPASWSLPPGSAASFPIKDNAQNNGCSSSAQFSWSTFDIDADGLPDLVVTQKCFDAAIGKTQWNVYENSGAGFAANPTAWSLPAGSAASFPIKDNAVSSGCSSSAQFFWSTFDIDADGLPDLVVTQKCFDAAIGKTQWNVYKNGGSGFATAPSAWSLPSGSASSFPVKDLAQTLGCSSSAQFSWATFDIDGDAHPDLVVTQQCFDATLGKTHWNVYAGGNSGFAATPSCFALPSGYGAFPFTDLATSGCSSSTQYSWSTLDMNNDQKPDLLVTLQCFDPTLGVTHWNWHENQR
jgi:hypothetical protein